MLVMRSVEFSCIHSLSMSGGYRSWATLRDLEESYTTEMACIRGDMKYETDASSHNNKGPRKHRCWVACSHQAEAREFDRA
jgi:hypothetical protein